MRVVLQLQAISKVGLSTFSYDMLIRIDALPVVDPLKFISNLLQVRTGGYSKAKLRFLLKLLNHVFSQ